MVNVWQALKILGDYYICIHIFFDPVRLENCATQAWNSGPVFLIHHSPLTIHQHDDH